MGMFNLSSLFLLFFCFLRSKNLHDAEKLEEGKLWHSKKVFSSSFNTLVNIYLNMKKKKRIYIASSSQQSHYLYDVTCSKTLLVWAYIPVRVFRKGASSPCPLAPGPLVPLWPIQSHEQISDSSPRKTMLWLRTIWCFNKFGLLLYSGDILGSSINNLDQLLRMPYGCGEQNMVNFAPNIYVMKYLKTVNQLTQNLENKAKNFMISGQWWKITR